MAHRSASVQALARSPLRFRTSIVRPRSLQVYQARQLWWWSRKSFGPDPIDDEQERFLRQQRHIRSRYAKIIRRRSMWDRDTSPSTWPWQRRRPDRVFQDLHNLSSNNHTRSRETKDRDDPVRDNFKAFHNDFNSLRKVVDRAIERDAYGALFGRRLWSPPSTNNSSWTSFSWIFDPKEIKDESEKTHPNPLQATSPTETSSRATDTQGLAPTEPSARPAPMATTATTDAALTKSDDIEYEYDPISMRKVPKRPTVTSAPQPHKTVIGSTEPPKATSSTVDKAKIAPKRSSEDAAKESTSETKHKTIFDILFGENAVDIPVKTYTPKIYGYDAKDTTEKKAEKKSQSSRFETSRKREFQALRAATLGNTIDTTAEFFGKYRTESDAALSSQAKSGATTTTDDTLFAGTAYDGKFGKIVGQADQTLSQIANSGQPAKLSGAKSSWLEQEGFTAKREPIKKGFNQNVPTKHEEHSHEVPIKRYTAVEPSLNRLVSQQKSKSDRLQPSLDRAESDLSPSKASSRTAWESKVVTAEKAEDIDLLRASDVRAYMKADRTTRQEIDQRKQQNRQKLERDFASREVLRDPAQEPGSSYSSAVDHVWRHVEANKDGIVARTIRSMALLNDNLKKITRTEAEPRTEPFTKDPIATVPSHGSSEPLNVPRESSKQAVDALNGKSVPGATPEHTSGATRSRIAVENEKLDKLAEEIHGAYQAQNEKTDLEKQPSKAVEARKPHPLSTASVKEWVTEDSIIQDHIRGFEPAYARLVDEMKNVRRNLHEAKLNIKDIRASISKKSWSELEAARLAEYAKEQLVEEEASASGLDEPVFAEAKKVSEDNIESLDQPVARHEPITRETYPRSFDEPMAFVDPSLKMAADLRAQTDTPRRVERPTMEEPVFTPSGSPVWNDEQPPPLAELKAAITEFSSPVVILVYDSSDKAVKAIPSPNLPTLARRKNLNPFSLLAGLDTSQAADFLSYFPRLQNNGYELVDGDKDKLIFRKPSPDSANNQSVSGKATKETKEAATVLNEMPADIAPPGPYAPIPPPSSYPSSPTRASRQSHIRRQEPVFSGTTTAATMPIDTPAAQHISSSPPQPSSYESPTNDYETHTSRPGIFSRLARTVRRVTLTIFALAAGAYTTGVVAEGMGAQEQANKGISQADPVGPRKKIVLPQALETSDNYRRGTRPGIYSTESSRRE